MNLCFHSIRPSERRSRDRASRSASPGIPAAEVPKRSVLVHRDHRSRCNPSNRTRYLAGVSRSPLDRPHNDLAIISMRQRATYHAATRRHAQRRSRRDLQGQGSRCARPTWRAPLGKAHPVGRDGRWGSRGEFKRDVRTKSLKGILYHQLAKTIHHLIASGELRPCNRNICITREVRSIPFYRCFPTQYHHMRATFDVFKHWVSEVEGEGCFQ